MRLQSLFQSDNSLGSFAIDTKSRIWGMLCHSTAFAGFLVPWGNLGHAQVPFSHFIFPLFVWLFSKDVSSFVNAQGKEAVNFQFSMIMLYLFCKYLLFWLEYSSFIWVIAIVVAETVLVGLAGIKALLGISHRYPFTIRFIK